MIDPYTFMRPRRPGESSIARHDELIAGLPAQGGTIIVITNAIGRYLMKGVRYERGFAVRKRWRFISVHRLSDCAKMVGLRGQVLIDHTFVEHAKLEAQAEVRLLVNQIWAMHV